MPPELGGAAKGPAVLDDKPAVPAASEPAGPSIFEASQDQLGLKLEATRGPVESIVIISAERPTAN